MATHTLTKLYRTAYLVGVALLIASLALLWPTAGNVNQAGAQTGWFLTVDCTGFELDAPEHPAIDVRSQVKAPGETTWGDRQEWSLSAGGPATYTFTFDSPIISGSEILVRVFEAGTNNAIFAEKQDVFCGEEPTNTPEPPTATPTNTDIPTATPTNTDVPTATPTSTTPPGEPSATPTSTNTPVTPTATFTNTPVTPTSTTPPGEPSATPTPTDTGSLPTPTPTFGVSATPTDTGSIPTPTTPPDQQDPTSTPGGGGSIPSPVPQGTSSVLIPVTGLDTSFNFTFLQRTLMNLGFGFLGLGLVLHGLSLGGRKKDE